MVDTSTIAEIIATYQKHGWILRRILLTKESHHKLLAERRVPDNVEVTDSVIDAAWFSRPPNSGSVAWELRYLGDLSYAILEKLDEVDPEFDNIRNTVEQRLFETIASKTSA